MNGPSRRTLRRLALGATAVAAVAVPATASAVLPANLWAQGYSGGTNNYDYGTISVTPDGGTLWGGVMRTWSGVQTATFGSTAWGPSPAGACEDSYIFKAAPTGAPDFATGTSSAAGASACSELYSMSPSPDSSLLLSFYNDEEATVGASGTPWFAGAGRNSSGFIAKVTPDGTVQWINGARPVDTSHYSAGEYGVVAISAVPGGDGRSVAFGYERVGGITQPYGAVTVRTGAVGLPHMLGVSKDGEFTGLLQATDAVNTDPASHGGVALSDGSAVMAGSYWNSNATVTFGSTTLTHSGDGDADFFFAKGTPGGTWQWATRAVIKGWDWQSPRTAMISASSDGSVYVAGYFTNTATFGSHQITSSGGSDAFIAKLSPSGTWEWARAVGDPATNDSFKGMHVFPNGKAMITGAFSGTVAFGSTSITSAGGTDVMIAEIGPDGTWNWATSAGGSGNDSGSGVFASPDGRIAVYGTMTAPAAFDANTVSSGDRFVTNYLSAPQSAPLNVKAVGGLESATISWDPIPGGTVSSYTVTAEPGGATCTVDAPATSCTITGLTPGKRYTFSVTGRNVAGTSPVGTADAVPTGRTADNQKAAESAPRVSVPAATVARGRTLTAVVNPSTPGRLTMRVTFGKATACTSSKTVRKSGRTVMTCRLSAAAQATIRRRAVTLVVRATLTDPAGKAATASRAVKVKRFVVRPVVTG